MNPGQAGNLPSRQESGGNPGIRPGMRIEYKKRKKSVRVKVKIRGYIHFIANCIFIPISSVIFHNGGYFFTFDIINSNKFSLL